MSSKLADKIREMRERTGLGLEECKRILRKEVLLDQLDRATTVDDLKRIIRELI